MIIIGIDPHKTSHVAVAVDQHEQPVGQRTVLPAPRPPPGCWPGPSSGRNAAGRSRAPVGWATTSPSSWFWLAPAMLLPPRHAGRP
jgi:hypothetical protein